MTLVCRSDISTANNSALLSCRLDVVEGGTPVKQSLTTMSRQTTKTLYDRYATLRKLLESLRSYLHLSQSNLASRIRWEGERELLPETYTTSPLSKYFPCPPAVAFPSNGTMSRAKHVLLLLVFIVAFQHIHTQHAPKKRCQNATLETSTKLKYLQLPHRGGERSSHALTGKGRKEWF